MVALARQQGYLLRDEGEGPGIPRPDGSPSTVRRLETHTRTCCHCNRVVIILPDATRAALGLPLRSHPRGYCPKCDAYVCDAKACQSNCTPTMLLVDIARRYPDVPVFFRSKTGEVHPKLREVLTREGRII